MLEHINLPPRETFAYLESRYGRIPRPESPKVVDEANREHNLPFEQCAAEDSTQSAGSSNDEPENSPGELVDSPSDCAEITTGHLEPETEIIDAQRVDYLPLVEVGAVDSERLDELADTPREGKTPDLEDKSLEGRDSDPGYWEILSNEGYEPIDSPIEDTQCLSMDDETIVNVPDPPSSRSELPTIQVKCPTSVKRVPTRTHSATSTDFILPMPEPMPKDPDKAEHGGWHDDGASSGHPDSHQVRKSMLTGNRGQHTECKAKRPNRSPTPPTPFPKRTGDASLPYRVPHRCGRLKSNTESISNTHTRRNAYCVQVVPKWIPPYLSTSTKRLGYLMGGSWMVTVCYNKVRHAIRVETRGYTHHGSHTNVSPPHEILLHLQNISITFWQQVMPSVSIPNDGRWSTSLLMVKWLPVSSRTRQGDEHRAKWPNDLPVPSKPARSDFAHPPGTLRDPRRRGRIKTDLGNVCNVKTRGRSASIPTIPISPPRELARTLWNVANTYWRHGIPPGWTCNVKIPSLFETAASRQRYKARGHRRRRPDNLATNLSFKLTADEKFTGWASTEDTNLKTEPQYQWFNPDRFFEFVGLSRRTPYQT
ncbi:hypothetical protein EDD15DRAFT_2420252 [Pisolithus albus]|nr:hypothetical protein EDD15DRAFT_2420252 [Pisolithus albus]